MVRHGVAGRLGEHACESSPPWRAEFLERLLNRKEAEPSGSVEREVGNAEWRMCRIRFPRTVGLGAGRDWLAFGTVDAMVPLQAEVTQYRGRQTCTFQAALG